LLLFDQHGCPCITSSLKVRPVFSGCLALRPGSGGSRLPALPCGTTDLRH
jgi:hypothetical protein